MSQADHIGEDGEWYSPLFDLDCDPAITLNWANTLIRTFGFPFRHLDHIEYRSAEGTRGLRATRDLLDLLIEKEFPYRFDYFPDEETVDWHVAVDMLEAARLDMDGLPPSFDDML